MNCIHCGRNLDSIRQDNVSNSPGKPVCEDCSSVQDVNHDGCPNDCSLCGEFCVYD